MYLSWVLWLESSNPWGYLVYTDLVSLPLRKALLMSTCCISYPFETAIDRTAMIIDDFTTGL